MSIAPELFDVLSSRKKFWLLQFLVLFGLVGGLLVLSQGSVVAPFIFSLF